MFFIHEAFGYSYIYGAVFELHIVCLDNYLRSLLFALLLIMSLFCCGTLLLNIETAKICDNVALFSVINIEMYCYQYMVTITIIT